MRAEVVKRHYIRMIWSMKDVNAREKDSLQARQSHLKGANQGSAEAYSPHNIERGFHILWTRFPVFRKPTTGLQDIVPHA
jgi:hypothetical protein